MTNASLIPSLSAIRARAQTQADDAAVTQISERPTIDPTAEWFAAQTNPRCEVRAMHGVAALGWAAFLPFGWRWHRPRHAPSDMIVLRRRCAMPGYLFVAAPRDARGDIRIAEARDVDGVRDLVRQGLAPLKIRRSAIEKLQVAESRGVFDLNNEPPRGKLWDLQPGDQIKITVAPFEGWLATVVTPCSNQKVWVVDNVFGQKFEVPLASCIPVEM